MWSVQRVYNEIPRISACVEAGSNTSTVTLRDVGGDENGSLKSETVKYGHESPGTRTRERLCWRGPEAYIKDRPVFSSEDTKTYWLTDRQSQCDFDFDLTSGSITCKIVNIFYIMTKNWLLQTMTLTKDGPVLSLERAPHKDKTVTVRQ
jgi:hypothetical protein